VRSSDCKALRTHKFRGSQPSQTMSSPLLAEVRRSAAPISFVIFVTSRQTAAKMNWLLGNNCMKATYTEHDTHYILPYLLITGFDIPFSVLYLGQSGGAVIFGCGLGSMSRPAYEFRTCREALRMIQEGTLSVAGITNKTLASSGWIWDGPIALLGKKFPRENITALTYKGKKFVAPA
jgi:hypothetical protein